MPAWLASSWLLLPLLPPLLLPLLLGVKGATSDWRGDEELAAAAQRLLGCEARESCCEIAELWDEAAKAWLTRHQRNDRSNEHDVPRLLRFRPHTAAQQQGIWSRPELLRRHGDLRLERRRAVEVAQFGPGHAYEASASSAGTISLRAAAAALRRPGGADQWFDRGVGPTLLEAATAGGAELPSVNQLSSLQAAANESVLSLGRSRSGLPFHSHGESWLALLRGQKLWLLLPPGPLEPEGEAHGTWGHTDTLLQLDDWLQAKLQRQVGGAPRGSHAPIVCVQAEGDLIYLPSAWSHATINATQINRLHHRVGSFPQKATLSVALEAEAAGDGSRLRVGSSSRQEMLANIEAVGPSSPRGLELLRELRAREPGNVDTVARLVSALLNTHGGAHMATTSSKHRKKQKDIKEQHARKAAVKEVHAAIREVSQMLLGSGKWDARTIVDDWAAMQVRCCALLSDLAQYKAATKCLGDVSAAVSRDRSIPRPNADIASTPNVQLHYELARASLRSIEKAMRRGEEVFRSQVEPIAQEVRLALAIDSQHTGAMELARILAAAPPVGLGWDDSGA